MLLVQIYIIVAEFTLSTSDSRWNAAYRDLIKGKAMALLLRYNLISNKLIYLFYETLSQTWT